MSMNQKAGSGIFWRLFKWGFVLLVLAGIGFLIWRYTRPAPIEVAVKPVTQGTVERTVANTRAGTVKACRRAKLSPSIGGQIAKLPIHEGDAVKEGELLLELWNKDLVAQVALAEREVTVARSRLRSITTRAELSRRTADRQLKLRMSDAVSAERLDNAVFEAQALKAEAEGAQIEIGVGEARLALAKANLERTRLVAPFDGTIADINGELFEFVTPSPLGVPTPPVVDIIGSGCFFVIAPIDEVDVADVRVGMPVRITMDAFGSRRFNGRVRRISDYVLDVEKQARTVDVEVDFDDPKDIENLLAGYSADIEIILDTRPDVVRVPTEAVMEGDRVYLFLADTGLVKAREIKKGLSNWEQTQVLEGLTPGQQVVVNVDKPGLKDGILAVQLEEKP